MNNKTLLKNSFDLVEEMTDWVRIVGSDNIVLYTNKKMQEAFGRNLTGEKCCGISAPEVCEDCIVTYTISTGKIGRRETYFEGRTYNVISSPLKDENGNVFAAVEVFRDITTSKELAKELNETNRKMMGDLKFAKNMQYKMLPEKTIYNGLKLDYFYQPSDMLSGDIIDTYTVKDRYTCMYVCDVVGHGVSAALLTVFVRQSMRALSQNIHNVNKTLVELHKMFLSLNLDYDKYLSLFFGVYDKQTKKFTYANAGHNAMPIHLSSGKMSFLKAKGNPICNIFTSVEYKVSSVKLKLGDKIFFYTDGIPEAKNSDNDSFGETRLFNIVKKSNNLLSDIYNEVNSFSEANLKDDCAMMLVEVIN